MQETVFGEQQCLGGQIAGVLLSEPTTNLKTIFDAGLHFASIFSQDNDVLELTSRFVFCYAPAAYHNNTCLDLIPPGRFAGLTQTQHCRTTKIQDTLNSVGGIQTILPILYYIMKSNENPENVNETIDEFEEINKTPVHDEPDSDWEMLSSNLYSEWKMMQHPLANFLCFLRYLTHGHENNQENLHNTECLSIIGKMLQKCPRELFDINALMATHLFIESIQCYKSSNGHINSALLMDVYTNIAFNFDIWARLNFQITLGHTQYLSAMLKSDRKYFRKRFGVQYFLDIIRQYYCIPEYITADDAKTMRSTLFSIIRFYIQKDVNIKEVNIIIAFLASIKQDNVLIEFLDILSLHLKSKNCREQFILLLHEPQSSNLLYNFFIEKSHGQDLQDAAIRVSLFLSKYCVSYTHLNFYLQFISNLLLTSRVEAKYKQMIRLIDSNSGISLFPGLFSYTSNGTLSSTVLFHMIDEMLNSMDCRGLIFLIHYSSSCELSVKLEIAKRLLQTTFVKSSLPQAIAKEAGWQESIARLLIRRQLSDVPPDKEKRKSFGINVDVLLDDSNEFNAQADLISLCDEQIDIERSEQDEQIGLNLNELQASVSEAANVIETEIKGNSMNYYFK